MKAIIVNETSGTTTILDLESLKPFVTFQDSLESKQNTLCCIKDDYVLWANVAKPTLSAFAITTTAQQVMKKVMPGKVNSACISGRQFICCGIGENIMIWDLISGDMIASMSKHHRNISKVQFVSNSRLIVAAGLDGLVSIWSVPYMISSGVSHHTSPKASLQVSLQEINDMWCSPSRIYTSSDKYVTIVVMESMTIVSQLFFGEKVSSISVDLSETTLYVGFQSGNICEVDLTSIQSDPALKSTRDLNLAVSCGHEFVSWKTTAHSAKVSSIVVGSGGNTFVSGSDDKTVKVWTSWSLQSEKSIEFESSVCSLQYYFLNSSVLDMKHRPSFQLPPNFLSSDRGIADGEKCILGNYTEEFDNMDVCNKADVEKVLLLPTTEPDIEKEALYESLDSLTNKYNKLFEQNMDQLISK